MAMVCALSGAQGVPDLGLRYTSKRVGGWSCTSKAPFRPVHTPTRPPARPPAHLQALREDGQLAALGLAGEARHAHNVAALHAVHQALEVGQLQGRKIAADYCVWGGSEGSGRLGGAAAGVEPSRQGRQQQQTQKQKKQLEGRQQQAPLPLPPQEDCGKDSCIKQKRL